MYEGWPGRKANVDGGGVEILTFKQRFYQAPHGPVKSLSSAYQ